MAEAHGQTGGHPAMDYPEHERTYDAFIRFSVLGTIWVITIVVGLAIGATAHRWGLGSFMIVLSTIATAVGVFVKGLGEKPGLGVLVLSLLAWLATA
jgi:hypothetical protein